MDVIQVEGGYPVTGTVTVEGAKNSALKLMAATLMASGVTTLTNVHQATLMKNKRMEVGGHGE